MFIQMSYAIWTHNMFKQLTRYTSQGNWAIIARTFLKSGQIFARDHSFGISPVSIDCWKRLAITGPNSVANSLRILGWSSPGPKAFEGFNPLRGVLTPSLETQILSMKGTELYRRGTWLCSFLLNTSVNWPFSYSAFSWSDWATPLPLLF